jgi:hypothetical protein
MQYKIEILAPKNYYGHIEFRDRGSKVTDLRVSVPVAVKSIDLSVSFETDLSIELTKDFRIINKQGEIKNFVCKKAENCEKIKNDLAKNFAQKIMPFENGAYWDQISSYRLLKGLMTTALNYS